MKVKKYDMDFVYKSLKKYKDKRGFLVEFLKPSELSKKKFVQFFCATIKPGKLRGNHYHRTKDEWLIFLDGKAKLILEDVFSKKHKEFVINTSDNRIPKVKIGANIAHLVENTSKRNVIIVGYLTKIGRSDCKDRWEYKRYNLVK